MSERSSPETPQPSSRRLVLICMVIAIFTGVILPLCLAGAAFYQYGVLKAAKEGPATSQNSP